MANDSEELTETHGRRSGLPDPQALIDAISSGDDAEVARIRAQARANLPDAMLAEAQRELEIACGGTPDSQRHRRSR